MLTLDPICIRIPGRFWDSHIYAGQLYVFGADKSLHRIDWPSLIGSHPKLKASRLATNGVLVDASFLYRDDSRIFLEDQTVNAHVMRLIAGLQGASVEIDLRTLSKRAHRHGASPFPNLHTDCEIYNARMYGAMPEGLYLAGSSSADDEPSNKIWDSSVYAVRGSGHYGSLAIAAAEEGLWEYDISVQRRRGIATAGPTISANRFCTACDWADQSIFGWSASTEGFLASFYTERARNESRVYRVPDRTIDARELCGEGASFWGSHNRAYALRGNELVVIDYDPKVVGDAVKKKRRNEAKAHLGANVDDTRDAQAPLSARSQHVHLQEIGPNQLRPVATATAPFGTVIQLGERLLVFRSDGTVKTIDGDIVTWRTFPRSLNYANQLHVVLDDRLEIYAFLHDYFVDQTSKVFGYTV